MVRKRISQVFIIITSVAFIQIFNTILLARTLSKHDMGFWRLILTLSEVGTLLGVLGIDNSFVRFFSSPLVSIQQYDWKTFLKRFFLISLLITLITSAIAYFIYNLTPVFTLFLLTLIMMLISVFIFASFLRAKQKYELAIFFSRSNFLIFFALFMVIYILKTVTLNKVLICYFVSAIMANLITVCYCLKKIPNGTDPIPRSVFKNGLYYFGMGLAILFMLQTGNLVIGKFLSYADLAVYSVNASIMRLFEFIQDSSYYVLAPHLNQAKNFSSKKIFSVLFFLGLVSALLYLAFAKQLVHFLFGGLYDEGAYLIPFFIGIGFIRTLFVLPASIIGAKSSEAILKNQVLITSAAAALNLVLAVIFIHTWQLKGIAAANLISWGALFVAALFLTRKYIIFTDTNEAISI